MRGERRSVGGGASVAVSVHRHTQFLRACASTLCLAVLFACARSMADPPEQNRPAEAKPNATEKPETQPAEKATEPKEEWYSIHAQATVIGQGNGQFRSPYFGPNSLLPNLNYRTTQTGTVYLDT